MGWFGLSAGSTRRVYGRGHGRFAVLIGLAAVTAMLLGLGANPERAQAATGQITGHITDGSSNNLQGVVVIARNLNGFSRTDTTDSSGNYTITGLSTGPYIVHFDAGGVVGDFASGYYNDKSSFSSANHVAVTDGQTTPNIDAALAAGGTINGHVTDDSNAALEGVCVTAFSPEGDAEFDVRTDVGGNYSMTNVGAGSWKLYFDPDPSGCALSGNFAAEYYNDKPDLDSADPVVVTAGATTSNINASLASQNDLSVQLAGLGSGTVTSSPAGINCGSTCSANFNSSTSVILTAAPGAGSTFAGWSGGGCSGTGTCQVTMSQARSVTATFTNNPPVQRTLTVARTGTGSGTATSNPAGINCGSTCSAQFNNGIQVILTAAAASGSTFTGWSGGGCSGAGTCRVTVSSDQAVTATFSANPPPPPSLPNTKISKAKIDQQNNSATFMFTQVGGGKAKATSGFQCALLEKKHAKPNFKKCTSPTKYKHLKPRRYTFEVRALSSAGKDQTPAKMEFRIKP